MPKELLMPVALGLDSSTECLQVIRDLFWLWPSILFDRCVRQVPCHPPRAQRGGNATAKCERPTAGFVPAAILPLLEASAAGFASLRREPRELASRGLRIAHRRRKGEPRDRAGATEIGALDIDAGELPAIAAQAQQALRIKLDRRAVVRVHVA